MALATERDEGARLGTLHARYAEVGGYDARARAAQLMHGLGFDHTEDERPIRTFSGGWRVRINVARALMCRSDLLLLDEPTNHLDIDAILWLETWLRAYPGTLLLIAHDREFLDRVCNRIVNIEHRQVHAYRGNYSAFEVQRAAELAEQSALYVRQQREIRHMESFVERFRAKATKARQAQSRLKALERMQRIAPGARRLGRLRVLRSPSPPSSRARCWRSTIRASATADAALLRQVKFTLMPGDRLALLGPERRRQVDLHETAGRRAQRRRAARAPRRAICTSATSRSTTSSSSRPTNRRSRTCGAPAERAPSARPRRSCAITWRPSAFGAIGCSSRWSPFPAARRRAWCWRWSTYQRPNLLLLDEPTNHLDLEMRQALERRAAGILRCGGAGLARPAPAQHRGRRADRGARRARRAASTGTWKITRAGSPPAARCA